MRSRRRYFPQVQDATGEWISAGGRSTSERFAVLKMARAVAQGHAKGRVLMTGGRALAQVVIEMARAR